MERRVEPRFQINSRVTVTVLGNPERTVQCHLLDISATGMRLASDDRIVEGEVVTLDVADHAVLARILRSTWRGDAYVIGAERIDAIPRNRVAEQQPASEEQTQPEEAPPQVAEETATREPEPEPVEIAANLPEVKPEVTAPVAPKVPLKTPDLPPPTPMPDPSLATGRSWRVAGALAASLTIAVLGLVYFLQSRSHAKAPNVPEVAAAQPAPARLTPPPAPVAPRPVAVTPKIPAPSPIKAAPPAVSPARAPLQGAHKVEIKGLSPSWIAATADGKAVVGKVFAAGDTQEFEFSGIAFLHIGAAAGVEISLDGKPMGPLGNQMRLVELTPAGMQFLPWSNGDPVVDPKK